MEKNVRDSDLIYIFEDEGLKIIMCQSLLDFTVIVKYEEDTTKYICENKLEATMLMYSLLIEYSKKKAYIEELIDSF